MQKKIVLVLALLSLIGVSVAASPQDLLKGYESQSGKASQARGEHNYLIRSTAKSGVVLLVMKPLPITIPSISLQANLLSLYRPIATPIDLLIKLRLKSGLSAIVMMYSVVSVSPKKKPMCSLGY